MPIWEPDQTVNPLRRYYEQAGWCADGMERMEDWDGVPLHEVRYRTDFPHSPVRNRPVTDKAVYDFGLSRALISDAWAAMPPGS